MKNSKRIIIISFVVLFALSFYLINFDFSRIRKFICSQEETSQEQYGIPSYWLDRYHIKVSDKSDILSDTDGDGLSLLEEYKYFTNPLLADSDNDGYNDGKEVRDGYNPTGEGKMDMDGDKLPDNWEIDNGLSIASNDYNLDPDNDGLPNYLEFEHLTNPLEADTDGDGYNDLQEINNGFDPSAAGDIRPEFKIVIDKISVKAPTIFSASASEDALLEDLKKGVIRYPKTGVPGQTGNAVLSGHSSNYAWVKGDYNYVFSRLNELEEGDDIKIRVTQKNGKVLEYLYVVTSKDVLNPDNEMIFQDTGYSSLTITTCWPLNTNWNRLVVKAKLK
ncbi:MAG: sortase [Candidatus Moranbacteria bacterium]|jgi:LPXTG-site transpeptidase (sortase) family protein|nr:sortase [Candidatus Moranbacteria bacterium]MDX9855853.1 sortase [Candidatus Moranbacteria bacterium]